MASTQPRLAVIGAGISGLACAEQVRRAGWDVTVFEKSRGVGGRMATRRMPDDLQFDHGAQYFTARDERFQRVVREWTQLGVVAPWEGRIVDLEDGVVTPKENGTPRYVGVPGMNAACKQLAEGAEIRRKTRVVAPTRENGVWRLEGDDGTFLGEFDWVVTSAPAPQSADILAAAPSLQRVAASTAMNGCWALMLSFSDSLELEFDGAFVHQSPVSWLARNTSKPQRSGGVECWVVHASSEWTMEQLEASPEETLPTLTNAFWKATGHAFVAPQNATVHRWRYAIATEPLSQGCLFDRELGIGACGDWCHGSRVEGAFLSGMSLSEVLLDRPTR